MAAALLVGALAALPNGAAEAEPATTVLVSVDSDGQQANGDSASSLAISADGRFVAFSSVATNLVTGDTNGRLDVFVHDAQTGSAERVTVDSAENQAMLGGGSFNEGPSISADGRFVAFQSTANDLVNDDTNTVSDIFVRDRLLGVTQRVSVGSSGTQANSYSTGPQISANGRFVVFESNATNLVPLDANVCGSPPLEYNCSDVFLHDRETGVTERVSVGSAGYEANSSSWGASISGDGRYVTFSSEATNLVPNDSICRVQPFEYNCRDIYVHDRQTGTTEQVSMSNAGVGANGDSFYSRISDDGSTVVFVSDATNLAPADPPGPELFVRDRIAERTIRIRPASDASPAKPSVSANGRFVAWEAIDDPSIGDSNGLFDYFVHDRASGLTRVGSLSYNGEAVNGHSVTFDPALSGDGATAGVFVLGN